VDVKFDRDKLRNKKLFLATPMYDGRCYAEYAFPLCPLSSLCTQLEINLEIAFQSGDALVTKARNTLTDKFLYSGASHLMFIDADIGFNPLDVITLLALQESNDGHNDYDVLSAPYPIKEIEWDRVAKAVAQCAEIDEPSALKHYAGDVLLAPLHQGTFSIAEPVEVAQAGTGFMMIRRETLEAFRQAFPHRRYQAQNTATAPYLSTSVSQFFDTETVGGAEAILDELSNLLAQRPATSPSEVRDFIAAKRATVGEFVSEDFMFCRRVHQNGMKVWACPWMVLTHTGNYTFAAQLRELSRIV